MPKLNANLSMMFTEVPFPQRFEAAARAGFNAFEFLFPYEFPAAHIARWLADNSLENVLFNLPPGDWPGGERGCASIPGREAEFLAALERALEYADRLGTPRLHAMAGILAAGAPRQHQGRGTACGAGGAHAPHRADQPARHPRLLPQHAGRGARDP